MEWKIKRGNEEWTAADPHVLRAQALSGRIRADDYIFNPILQRWMYAQELAELRDVYTEAASLAEAQKMNRASFGLGCLGFLMLFLFPPAGVILMVIAIILSAFYYLKAPGAMDRLIAGGRGCGGAALAIAGVAVLFTVIAVGFSKFQESKVSEAPAPESYISEPLPTSLPVSSQESESKSLAAPAMVTITPIPIPRPKKPAEIYETIEYENWVAAFLDSSTRTYHLLGCPAITPRAVKIGRGAALKQGYELASDCATREPRGEIVRERRLTPASAKAMAAYEREMAIYNRSQPESEREPAIYNRSQ